MFNPLKKLGRRLNEFARYDAEAEALKEAGDRIEVEMIHRHFARQKRQFPYGY